MCQMGDVGVRSNYPYTWSCTVMSWTFLSCTFMSSRGTIWLIAKISVSLALADQFDQFGQMLEQGRPWVLQVLLQLVSISIHYPAKDFVESIYLRYRISDLIDLWDIPGKILKLIWSIISLLSLIVMRLWHRKRRQRGIWRRIYQRFLLTPIRSRCFGHVWKRNWNCFISV